MGKDIVLQFRVTLEERTELEARAEKENVSLSEYIRMQALPKDTDTYTADVARHEGEGRVINLSEIPEGERLPSGSLGKYDHIVSC